LVPAHAYMDTILLVQVYMAGRWVLADSLKEITGPV
jgi:hypothetical protein